MVFLAITLHSGFSWDPRRVMFRGLGQSAERDWINHIWVGIKIDTNWRFLFRRVFLAINLQSKFSWDSRWIMFPQLEVSVDFIWVGITIEMNWKIMFPILFIAIDLHSEFSWDSLLVMFRRR
jgi:hypothetical protein